MYKNAIAMALCVTLAGALNAKSEEIRQASKKTDFVDVQEYWKDYVIDLCFYTEKNFVGKKFYNHNTAFLQKDAAQALAKAAAEAQKYGYRIFISDAYRPLSVQKKLWDFLPDERYVANPAKGGYHTRGIAVDVTLVDKEGNKVPMPSEIDDMSEKAHRLGYEKLTLTERHNVLLLEKLMVDAGFEPYTYEWWHYNYKGWQSHKPADYSFEELVALAKK